ncbi:MAG: hypothetical protein AB7O96_14155 [Pseudobdellovibrionaceae bacterium]
MMKTLVVLFVMAGSLQVSAAPKEKFQARECGQRDEGAHTGIVAIKKVCTGELSRSGTDAVQLSLSDGSKQTFVITYKRRSGTAARLGRLIEAFSGHLVNDEETIVRGLITTTSGITRTKTISLETNQNLRIRAVIGPK